MEHKYSTYCLLIFLFLGSCVFIVNALDSSDLDDICNKDGSILVRYTGQWMCDYTTPRIGTYANIINETTFNIPINNAFIAIPAAYSNFPIEGFIVNISIPAIIYTADTPMYFEIQQHISLSNNKAGNTLHIGIAKNNYTYIDHKMGTFLKNINEPYVISQNEVIYLEKGDTIQLMIESELSNSDVTIYHHTTSIRRFY